MGMGKHASPWLACVGTSALPRLSPSLMSDLVGSVKVKFINVLDRFSLPTSYFASVPLALFMYVFSLCGDSPCTSPLRSERDSTEDMKINMPGRNVQPEPGDLAPHGQALILQLRVLGQITSLNRCFLLSRQ